MREAMDSNEDRLSPVRALVCCANQKGRLFPLTALKQWLRLCNVGYKAQKVDLLVEQLPHAAVMELLNHADAEDLPCSLRLCMPLSSGHAADYAEARALDVFFAPTHFTRAGLEETLASCAAASLPLRVQVTAALPADAVESLLAAAREERVTSVNVAASDPFVPSRPCPRGKSATRIAALTSLAARLKETGVEVNLLGLPFCLVPRELWPETLTGYQYYLHHQQYLHDSHDLAKTLFTCRPSGMAAAIEHQLSAQSNFYHIIDRAAFPRIISHPTLHARLWLINKVRRKWPRRARAGAPLPENAQAYEAAIAAMDLEARRALGPACAQCALRKHCDHAAPPLRALYPGLTLTPHRGEQMTSPLHFNRGQRKHFDAVDAQRRAAMDALAPLAAEARSIVDGVPPTKVLRYDEYDIEGHWTDRLVGAVRWWSLTTDPMRSTPLARVEPPFTVGVTFGGGIADHVGFTFGGHVHLLCPMIGPTHHVALHVRRDGRFVLLRDGQPVRPTEFTGVFRVPEKLGGVLEPRISIWNVDGHIQTQAPQLWLDSELSTPDLSGIVHSVIVPSTRYSRRLQALLLGIAHQANYDLRRIEVIVSYVPGLDSNDDVLDSIESAFPQLRIVRCTFSERHARSRGLMVNEAARMASGQWVTLFDSDIVVPVDFFARLDAVPPETRFVAPDGRKMLIPETTAQILLGERRPWEEFQSLLDGPGELWHQEAGGVPVGFCQIVRREVLLEFPYSMADHFEGSDWDFSQRVLAKYGKEHRLSGCYVLHLDHGGSQWYGVRKQK